MPLAILGSYRYITAGKKAFYAMMLVLETGFGVFCAVDLSVLSLGVVLVQCTSSIASGRRCESIYGRSRSCCSRRSAVLMWSRSCLSFTSTQINKASVHVIRDLVPLTMTFREQCFLFAPSPLAFAIKIRSFRSITGGPMSNVEAHAGSVVMAPYDEVVCFG